MTLRSGSTYSSGFVVHCSDPETFGTMLLVMAAWHSSSAFVRMRDICRGGAWSCEV